MPVATRPPLRGQHRAASSQPHLHPLASICFLISLSPLLRFQESPAEAQQVPWAALWLQSPAGTAFLGPRREGVQVWAAGWLAHLLAHPVVPSWGEGTSVYTALWQRQVGGWEVETASPAGPSPPLASLL